jgi:hypothetical protein
VQAAADLLAKATTIGNAATPPIDVPQLIPVRAQHRALETPRPDDDDHEGASFSELSDSHPARDEMDETDDALAFAHVPSPQRPKLGPGEALPIHGQQPLVGSSVAAAGTVPASFPWASEELQCTPIPEFAALSHDVTGLEDKDLLALFNGIDTSSFDVGLFAGISEDHEALANFDRQAFGDHDMAAPGSLATTSIAGNNGQLFRSDVQQETEPSSRDLRLSCADARHSQSLWSTNARDQADEAQSAASLLPPSSRSSAADARGATPPVRRRPGKRRARGTTARQPPRNRLRNAITETARRTKAIVQPSLRAAAQKLKYDSPEHLGCTETSLLPPAQRRRHRHKSRCNADDTEESREEEEESASLEGPRLLAPLAEMERHESGKTVAGYFPRVESKPTLNFNKDAPSKKQKLRVEVYGIIEEATMTYVPPTKLHLPADSPLRMWTTTGAVDSVGSSSTTFTFNLTGFQKVWKDVMRSLPQRKGWPAEGHLILHIGAAEWHLCFRNFSRAGIEKGLHQHPNNCKRRASFTRGMPEEYK